MKTYMVEHLDPELEAWSGLEYVAIGSESQAAGSRFVLSSVSASLIVPEELRRNENVAIEQKGVEELYASAKERVCLLDPAAEQELSPQDGQHFDVFLFGGILGDDPPRGRLSYAEKASQADDLARAR